MTVVKEVIVKKGRLKSTAAGGRRYSLAAIIRTAFISIVFLFITAMVLSNYRLRNFQSILSHIVEDSFPEITYSRNLHSQVNELLYLSSRLTNASNEVALRIAKTNIDSKLQTIHKDLIEKETNRYLIAQLKVISSEFLNLYHLVKHKLQIQMRIKAGQNSMHTLNEKMFRLSQEKREEIKDNSERTVWILTYSKAITLASQALTKTRLQEVRQSFRQVSKQIESLFTGLISLPSSSQKSAEYLTAQLQQLLLKDNGLLLMKIEQLRIAGRVIGRDNFIINLLADFSRAAEFKSYQINELVIDETKSIISRAQTEAQLMSFASVLVLIILFFVIYFIKMRFVERIMTLNDIVMTRLKGGNVKLDISGNDEISDLAKALNFFADKIEEQKQRLHDLSLTDGLTGLANRRALDQRLRHDLQTATRNQWPVVVLLMDIDFFKKYNDIYGHLAGDECLKKVSAALLSCKKRSTDFVARYGGEEFLVILPDTKPDGAQKVANNILAEVNNLNILHQGSSTASHVTLSIGIASFHQQPDTDSIRLLEQADKALYKAKSSGKNRSCYYR